MPAQEAARPTTLTPWGRLVVQRSVLTSVAWWQRHLRAAVAARASGTHLALLRERAAGWRAIAGPHYYRLTAHGRARFAHPAWAEFVAGHTAHTPESYWQAAMRETDRALDRNEDFMVGADERARGLAELAARFDEFAPTGPRG